MVLPHQQGKYALKKLEETIFHSRLSLILCSLSPVISQLHLTCLSLHREYSDHALLHLKRQTSYLVDEVMELVLLLLHVGRSRSLGLRIVRTHQHHYFILSLYPYLATPLSSSPFLLTPHQSSNIHSPWLVALLSCTSDSLLFCLVPDTHLAQLSGPGSRTSASNYDLLQDV